MQKFVVTADYHIGLRKDVPEAWQLNRYHQLFQQLIETCQSHKAGLIIAGDMWERAKPSLAELKLGMEFFRSLKEAGIKVYLISGNHCTLSEGLDTFQHLDMGQDKTIEVHYQPKVWRLPLPEEKSVLTFMNHCDLTVNPGFAKTAQNILISHFRCTVNQFIQEEIDVEELLTPFDLCIAGDIHLPYKDGKLWYTNQPINKDFERNPETGVILLTVDNGTHKVERIKTDLPKLIQIDCNAEDYPPAMPDPRHFYRVSVTGTPLELKGLQPAGSNEKVVPVPIIEEALVPRAEAEAELKDRPLEEDLVVYMGELSYSEDRTAAMMTVFREA